MAVLEITLAVILTLLGLAILAILLTRWTRRKQNEIDVSRYSSEQSAGLLDYEDGRDVPSQRSERARGFRHLYSTESDTSYDDQEGSKGDYTPSANSLALSRSSIGEQRGDAKTLKVTPEPLSGSAGPITGTIGPIMQFTAPIPGATGPIKLSQKTIVQTPGPIVQYTGPSGETSEMTTTGSSLGSTRHTNIGSVPPALTGPPPSMPRGVPPPPIMISQRTSSKFFTSQPVKCEIFPKKIYSIPKRVTRARSSKEKAGRPVSRTGIKEPPVTCECDKKHSDKGEGGEKSPHSMYFWGTANRFCHYTEFTPMPVVIGPVAAVDSSGKITLSPMVIFPGYMDAELAKKSDFKAKILKNGATTKSENSQEENKKTLKKEKLVTDSDESLNSGHKPETKTKAKDTELEKGEIKMEVKLKESDTRIPKEEDQVKVSDIGIPQEQEAHVEMNDTRIPQEQEDQEKKSEYGILQGQRSQVKKSESGIKQEQGSQVQKSESGIKEGQGSQVKSDTRIQGRESQVENSEAGIPQRQESPVENGEAGVPQGPQESPAKTSEAGTPQGHESAVKSSESEIPLVQGPQVKRESSEDQGEQGNARKKTDTEENDALKKSDEGKHKVKGKKESEVKSKKIRFSKGQRQIKEEVQQKDGKGKGK
ncbi:testis-expressed basic protein 1 [Lontra canadensis]|uniref:testis-expressed basic protein 1 n=1 Tax=Lontra canadensis TaxID=76717 RepID=UPI0013F2CDD8|nr:testis-expressed basic protein 1 [Lontra canadensis]